MSLGKLYLSAVIKSGQKNHLNRVRDILFSEPEKPMLAYIRQHILQFRTLPSPQVLSSQGYEYSETDQPPEYYQQELMKRCVFQKFKSFHEQFVAQAKTGIDLTLSFDMITSFTGDISRMIVQDQYKSMVELGREIQTQIENRKNGNPEVFIPFPWPTIQRLTGGSTGGDLIYFVARPGIGKSQLLSTCAFHAWKEGFKPLVLTMEMTDVQLARRIFGVAGEFNHDAMRKGIPDNAVEVKLENAISEMEESEVGFDVICGGARQTVESVASLIDELQPDVVFIDAAYLLNLKNSNAKTWEKIALVGEKLKEIAISRNVPIIQTVQFNRDAQKNKRFEMDNIAGSDAIAQLGSVIVAVQPGEEPHDEVRRKLEIIKNREGGVAEIEINYVFDPPNFSEIEYIAADEEELRI
jgi:replicative DNA helicase